MFVLYRTPILILKIDFFNEFEIDLFLRKDIEGNYYCTFLLYDIKYSQNTVNIAIIIVHNNFNVIIV